MLEREWFDLTKTTVVHVDDWATITVVYQWHPLIGEVTGKQDLLKLWKVGGMGLIRSLEKDALQVRDAEGAVTQAANRVNAMCRERDEEIARRNEAIAEAKEEVQELANDLRDLRLMYGKGE